MSCTECVVLLPVENIQNKASRKLQHTMQQLNLEQMTLQLVAIRYSLSVEMVWPSLVHGLFRAALEAAPSGSCHILV